MSAKGDRPAERDAGESDSARGGDGRSAEEGAPTDAAKDAARPRPFLLFRVDDRLLHGQVALGWGGPLDARAYLIADDRLAADADAEALYAMTAPPGSAVRVAPVAEAARQADLDPSRTILLVRGVDEAARLLRSGVPGPVVLGGLHAHAGARALLPYLFLTEEEERLLARLLEEGFAIQVQDLPGRPRRALAEIPGFTGGGPR